MPEIEIAVEDAYGRLEAVVEVAMKYGAAMRFAYRPPEKVVVPVEVKVLSPVQVLAEERSEVGVTIQVPLTEKHPAVMFKPCEKVLVAEAPERFRLVPVMPPVKVEVATAPKVAAPESALNERAAVVEVESAVEVAMKSEEEALRKVHASELASPSTSASCAPVELAMVSAFVGEEVPMPRSPAAFQTPELAKYAVPEMERAVLDAYGNTDAKVVEVAMMARTVGVVEDVMVVPSEESQP